MSVSNGRSLPASGEVKKLGDWELVMELPSELIGVSAFLGRRRGPRSFGRNGVVLVVPSGHVLGAPLPAALRRATAVSHPAVLSIQDMASAEGATFVVYDYVDGAAVAEIAASGPVPAPITVAIFQTAARGLHAIHGSAPDGDPVLHGALGPGSIVVGADGQTRVTGHGSGLLAGGDAVRGRTSAAPEVRAGAEQSVRSDIYALGAAMVGTLLGKPFAADPARLAASLFGRNASDADARLAGVLSRALASDPEQRFASADAFAGALEQLPAATDREVARFVEERIGPRLGERKEAIVRWLDERARALGDEPARAPMPPALRRLRRRARRLGPVAWVAALLALGSGLGALLWWIRG